MLNKLIRNLVIKTGGVLALTALTIPFWQNIEEKMTSSLATVVEASEKLELDYNQVDGYDNVIVTNSYLLEKTYRLVLVTTNECDEATIVINDFTHYLKEYEKEKVNGLYRYTILTNKIKGSSREYKMLVNVENNIDYYFVVEELTEI